MLKAAPKSRLWLWITLGLAGVLVVFGLVTFLIVQAVRREGSDEVSWLPLMEDRAGHEPKWRKSSFKAAGPADEPDGKTEHGLSIIGMAISEDAADEVFMTGTAAEITPVRSVDRKAVGTGKPGPITRALQDRFFGLFDGRTEDTRGWLTHVDAIAADEQVAA